MSRPLIIGQAPARGNDGLPPFSGKSGARLARLAGVGDTGDVLPQYFQLINLVDYWPGKAPSGRGDLFPVADATEKANRILNRLLNSTPRVVFLMGSRVARCFALDDLQMLEGRNWGGQHFIKFPHPSGASPYWNDPTRTMIARWMLRGALHDGR